MDYKEELVKFTKRMFRKYHLKGWKFEYSNSKKIGRGIICQTLPISQRILFNPTYIKRIGEIEKLQSCILHEIGHILNDCSPKHDDNFKNICKEIGCPYDEPTFTEIEMNKSRK